MLEDLKTVCTFGETHSRHLITFPALKSSELQNNRGLADIKAATKH